MFSKLWKDEDGIVALEYLLLATLVGLALIVGLNATSRALNAEFVELANAIASIDQSYQYQGQSVCGASVNGVTVTDATDGFTLSFGTTTTVIDQTVCP